MIPERRPNSKVTRGKAAAAFVSWIEAHVGHAFLPHVELQRETALTFFNNHFLSGQSWMRFMRLPCIRGDVYGERRFVVRSKLVSTPDFVCLAYLERIGRATDLIDRDEVAARSLFQIHDVRKVIGLLRPGKRSCERS